MPVTASWAQSWPVKPPSYMRFWLNATRREELKEKLAAADAPCCAASGDGRPYRQKVTALAQALEHPETRTEASEALRGLIDAIVLTPNQGELQIELKGNLAAMLGAAQNAKRSPETGDLSLQVVMVAGARNRQYRLPSMWSQREGPATTVELSRRRVTACSVETGHHPRADVLPSGISGLRWHRLYRHVAGSVIDVVLDRLHGVYAGFTPSGFNVGRAQKGPSNVADLNHRVTPATLDTQARSCTGASG